MSTSSFSIEWRVSIGAQSSNKIMTLSDDSSSLIYLNQSEWSNNSQQDVKRNESGTFWILFLYKSLLPRSHLLFHTFSLLSNFFRSTSFPLKSFWRLISVEWKILLSPIKCFYCRAASIDNIFIIFSLEASLPIVIRPSDVAVGAERKRAKG